MIKISNMYKSYSSKYTGKQEVFKDFSIDFPSKGFVSILGKSGCGKTTLLNVIGGIDSIDKGYVNVFGYDISKYSNGNTLIDEYRKDIVGFVFQSYNLINNISVYKNLALPLEMQGYSNEEIKIKIEEVLTKVEMIEYKNRMPYELSGGQQQRVAIARALIKKSKVVLADEPTGNLDSATATEILKLLKEISKYRLVIFITHDQEYADIYSDKVVQIKDGEIVNEYNLDVIEKVEGIKKAKSKVGIKAIFRNSFENIKLNLVKNLLIILLFTATITIMATSIVLITTSKEEVLIQIMSSKTDDFITDVTGSFIVTTNNNEFALQDGYNNENIFEIDDKYSIIQDNHGPENILLSSRVYVLNDMSLDFLFEWYDVFGHTRINLLKAGINYEIPNLTGRLPENSNEVIISDFLAFLIFGDENSIGEAIDINRYDFSPDFLEKQLTIVGIIETDYIEKGYLEDSHNLYNYFRYDGLTNISNPPRSNYHFTEHHIYSQIFALEEVFDGIDFMHKYMGGYGGDINFTVFVDGNSRFVWGDFYSSDIVDLNTLVGSLPQSNEEISISLSHLHRILPENDLEIQNLVDGLITWDEFIILVKLEETIISYDVESVREHYEEILPERVTIVGAFEIKEFNTYTGLPTDTIILIKEQIIALNNIYPYYDQGISFVNTSSNLEDMIIDVTNKDLVNLHTYIPDFDPIIIINREGSYNLYIALNTFETEILPMATNLLVGIIGFTFILLFLYSYLSIINNQKRIGIFRSLGFRRNDILKMFVVENLFVHLVSLIVGFSVGVYSLNMVNEYIFKKTIFINDMLFNYDIQSILITLGVTTGLIISTAIIPLIKILRMNPINIINKD